jgi:hypothetical protein
LENFFEGGLWKQKGQKGKQKKRWTGMSDNYDNFRQLSSALKDMKTASRTVKSKQESGWDGWKHAI